MAVQCQLEAIFSHRLTDTKEIWHHIHFYLERLLAYLPSCSSVLQHKSTFHSVHQLKKGLRLIHQIRMLLNTRSFPLHHKQGIHF